MPIMSDPFEQRHDASSCSLRKTSVSLILRAALCICNVAPHLHTARACVVQRQSRPSMLHASGNLLAKENGHHAAEGVIAHRHPGPHFH
jgi:hypothetical protein